MPGSFIMELNSKISLLEMDEYKNGWFQIQDESSALVSKIVNPLPGELVLDLCAAPGGKTVHMASLMNNKGRIIAGDINSARLKLISDNAKRLGVNIIEFNEGDARIVFPEKFSGKASHVLLDAPCSGLGILRRKLDARWNKKYEDIKALPSLQYELLESGYKCLIKGGTLVYSTCTIIPEENEDIIIKFLKNYPDMQLKNLKDCIPGEINKFAAQEGWIKILPSPSNSLDGFFIAGLVKEQ
ncbi:class I SAM-dependent methyltransferase [Candidatus Poribacteria bacterium]|nr:class I SAM-dependent methyltransferase [Candidatus Poribacteria bacterium]